MNDLKHLTVLYQDCLHTIAVLRKLDAVFYGSMVQQLLVEERDTKYVLVKDLLKTGQKEGKGED